MHDHPLFRCWALLLALPLAALPFAASQTKGQSRSQPHVQPHKMPRAQRHEVRREIDQLEEAWRTAQLNADVDALAGLLADDYLATLPNGMLQTKEQALEAVRSGRMHMSSLELSDRKVRFYGTTAVVTSRAEVTGTTRAGELDGAYRYTRVYVRDAHGAWKIVNFEASQIRLTEDRPDHK